MQNHHINGNTCRIFTICPVPYGNGLVRGLILAMGLTSQDDKFIATEEGQKALDDKRNAKAEG